MEEKRKTNWVPRKRSHSKHTGRMQSRLREMPEAAVGSDLEVQAGSAAETGRAVRIS